MPASVAQADQCRTSFAVGVEVRFLVPHRTGPDLDDVLSGQLGADGVRDVVHNPMDHGLTQLLSQCAADRLGTARAELLRTKYKPGRKLTAYYQLRIGTEARPIALIWSVESLSDTMDAADRQDLTAPRQLAAPFERLSARTDGGHTGLLIAPLDPQMPQLMRLHRALI